MITYHSTRGTAPRLSFEEVALAGLASDGGLYVPQTLPTFSASDMRAMAGLPYVELAMRVLTPFTQGALTEEELHGLLQGAYSNFRHAAIAPLKQLDANHFLLELFHGPTLAFKDFALQFLGRLMSLLLERRGEKAVVIGATSGDTGSAAIEGFRGREGVEIVILHPHGRVSDVQRRQMTTVSDKNVHNLALDGTFDDCQHIVKTLFADAELRARRRLVAVNSINWVRILAQTVYYFYAATALGAPGKRIAFSVPTGNFGDVYAGHVARRMGLPIEKLIIATNRNDVLARAFAKGVYGMEDVVPSLSPSMDIQLSSNFERLMFETSGAEIPALMQRLQTERKLALPEAALGAMRKEFSSHAVSDEETTRIIRDIHATTGEVLDPHTAVGVGAALKEKLTAPIVTLATAHPAKFPDAVEEAIGHRPELPQALAPIMAMPERVQRMENSAGAVRAFVEAL